ncbi:phage/plasmid primase, P4 family [Phycisphaerales bacterium ac7]
MFRAARCPYLVRWRGEFYEHAGPCYVAVAEDELWSRIRRFIADVGRWRVTDRRGEARVERAPFATKKFIGEVLDSLRINHIPQDRDEPCWMGPGDRTTDARDVIPLKNGRLILPRCTVSPSGPDLFNLGFVDAEYANSKPAPTPWTCFLQEVFSSAEEIAVLQEWCGLLLTTHTRFQKALILVGPPGSGKSTICRVLVSVLGGPNVASTSINALGDRFGLQHLVGKRVAILEDARVESGSATRAGFQRFLAISGEDQVQVDRKFKDPVTVALYARLMLVSNELPIFNDSAGALQRRLLILRTSPTQRAADPKLVERLLQDRSAILSWAVEGLQRLLERGRFPELRSSDRALEEMRELANPLLEFIVEHCELDPQVFTPTSDLYGRYRDWARAVGQRQLPRNVFARSECDPWRPDRACAAHQGRRARVGLPRHCAAFELALLTPAI